jgi:hypothetical protein
VNKLEHKGSTGDNPLTAWKKISSDDPKDIKTSDAESQITEQHTFPRH